MNTPLLLMYLVAFICAFAITCIIERLILPRLRARAAQPIYAEGPCWHKSKVGTPTLGGIAFVIAIDAVLLILSLVLFAEGMHTRALLLISTVAYATLNAAVGVVDDICKLRRRANKGLSALQKILLQALIAAGYMLALGFIGTGGTRVIFSFGVFNLGIFYYPIAMVILLGIVNCANLTDGIDGLASSVAFGIGCVLLLLTHTVFPETSFVGAALMGGCGGFLVYNLNPAKIFMGDTGSLYLGGMVAASSFSVGNMLLAVVVGIVYVIEGISVILQVLCFKATGKRIFKMAPLHHHLEKCGWSENKICITALLVTLVAAIPAVIVFFGG